MKKPINALSVLALLLGACLSCERPNDLNVGPDSTVATSGDPVSDVTEPSSDVNSDGPLPTHSGRVRKIIAEYIEHADYAPAKRMVEFSYDDLSRPTKMVEWDSRDSDSFTVLFIYEGDTVKQLEEDGDMRTYTLKDGFLVESRNEKYSYDESGHISTISYSMSDNPSTFTWFGNDLVAVNEFGRYPYTFMPSEHLDKAGLSYFINDDLQGEDRFFEYLFVSMISKGFTSEHLPTSCRDNKYDNIDKYDYIFDDEGYVKEILVTENDKAVTHLRLWYVSDPEGDDETI